MFIKIVVLFKATLGNIGEFHTWLEQAEKVNVIMFKQFFKKLIFFLIFIS